MGSVDPVVLFFVLGVAAGLLRSDVRLPSALYESLSIVLLIAIGLKGGVELAKTALGEIALPALAVVLMGLGTPLVAYPVLTRLGRFRRPDAASIAAHYGSVSVVTFAVGAAHLTRLGVPFEGYMTVFLVLLEMPALVAGVLLAKGIHRATDWRALAHEILCGKSIFLLAGGLAIGWLLGPEGIRPIDRLYFDLFKGILTLFLLEMGLITAARLQDLKRAGAFLIAFGIAMPLVSAVGGAVTGWWLGLSVGGTTLLATLYASASYIAAPAAMRIAVPEANPALSIGASLGVTFPFNIVLGIPIYHAMAKAVHGLGG
ncbi:MAG: sodium-dependent bicarbonate transport family permease [Pseudomonadota bacterium]